MQESGHQAKSALAQAEAMTARRGQDTHTLYLAQIIEIPHQGVGFPVKQDRKLLF